MRRAFQIVVAILSLIPIGFGSVNFIHGAARYMPAEAVTAPIDSQFRFESAIYVAFGLMLWWMIPRLETTKTPFRLVAAGIFAGGIGRVISYTQYGEPLPPMVYGMYLELAMPLFVAWHWWVMREG